MAYSGVVDAIAQFRAASEANDVDKLVDALAPDAELVSPLLTHGVFRGRRDLGVLFAAVYGTVTDVHWTPAMMDGDRAFMIAETRLGPFRLDDAMAFELGPDGLIRRLRPHLRPWLASTCFALVVGVKMARHPGVVWRAMRRS